MYKFHGDNSNSVYIILLNYIPCCHGNHIIIDQVYKLKDGSSRLDRDITGTMKPLIVTGTLTSCYIIAEYGRCER